eukprot:5534946-Amphidinium_carterae.2
MPLPVVGVAVTWFCLSAEPSPDSVELAFGSIFWVEACLARSPEGLVFTFVIGTAGHAVGGSCVCILVTSGG